MSDVDFYNRYGRFIERAQLLNMRVTPCWPYVAVETDFPISIPDHHRPDLRNRFSCLGADYPISSLAAVLYQEGSITYWVIPADYAVISYQFTGCYMARFTINRTCYVCHISSRTGDPKADTKAVWNAFFTQYGHQLRDLAVFRPTNAKDYLYGKFYQLRRELKQPVTVAGLITPDNRCYTLLWNYETCQVVAPDCILEITSPLYAGVIPLN